MKIYGDIKKQIGLLSKTDKQKVQQLMDSLKGVQQAKGLSPEGLHNLFNIQTQLSAFTQNYASQLLSLMKQNHMVD